MKLYTIAKHGALKGEYKKKLICLAKMQKRAIYNIINHKSTKGYC